MKENRTAAISETLKWEGGYTNDPRDPGGATNWGITIFDARKYWKSDATPADVKAMPKDVAIHIYEHKYWKTPYYDCDNLPAGVDLCVFDFGVNSGPATANRHYELSKAATDKDTINNLCDRRLAYLKVIKNKKTGALLWNAFGKGWANRVAGIRATCLKMAGTPSPAKKAVTGVLGAAGVVTAASYHQAPDWLFAELLALGFTLLVVYGIYKYMTRMK